jgi:protein TonB
MPRDLFDDVAGKTVRVGTRQWYTVPLSMMSHLLVLGILVSAPLMATRVLPAPESIFVFVAAPALPSPPSPPLPPPAVDPPRPVDAPAAASDAPAVTVAPADAEPAASGGLSLPGLPASDGPSAFPAGTGAAVPLPPAPAAGDPSVQRGPLPVGGAVKAPRKVRDVLPVYPAIARAARAQGTVILEAVITKEGRVRDVRIEHSIPMLDAAAMDAVRQWQYTVPTLNGQPVDVRMTVTVHFELR